MPRLHKRKTDVQMTMDRDIGALDENLYGWEEEKASKKQNGEVRK